jgi:hypothetical protein
MSVLQGIMNPGQADIMGAMDKGKERQSTGMAGDILGNTLGGQLGNLARLSPDKAMELAKVFGIPTNSEGRIKNMMGVTMMGTQLLQAGMHQEAAQFLGEEAEKVESLTGQPAEKLRMAQNAILTGDQEMVGNFMKAGQAFLQGAQSQGKSVGQREFESLTSGLNAEDAEKARRIKLRLDPGAMGSAEQTITASGTAGDVAETVATISEGKESGKLTAQGALLPGIRKAIKLAEAEGAGEGETALALRRAKAGMPGLEDVSEKLKRLADVATYTMGGKAINFMAKELGFGATKGGTARSTMTSIVNNQVLPLLRETFGAAFTEAEGDKLRDTLLDPDSTPEAKKESLDAFIAQKYRNIEAQEAELTAGSNSALPQGSVDNGDGTFTLPTGEIVEPN